MKRTRTTKNTEKMFREDKEDFDDEYISAYSLVFYLKSKPKVTNEGRHQIKNIMIIRSSVSSSCDIIDNLFV